MAKEPQLKINVVADASGVQKGVHESKRAMKDFEQMSSGALEKIAGAFGVNVQGIQRMESAMKGLGMKLQETGVLGKGAAEGMNNAFKGLSTSVAAIGVYIGLVKTAFKLLKAEAENYRGTEQGAGAQRAADAYKDTFKQAMHDANQDIAKDTADAIDGVGNWWTRTWEKVKASAVRIIQNGSGIYGMMANIDSGQKIHAAGISAEQKAQRAAEIAAEIYELERKISAKTVEWAESDAKIAEYREIAYDNTAATADKQEALVNLESLIKSRYEDEYKIRKKIADLTQEQTDLTSSTPAEIDAKNQLLVHAANIHERMSTELKSIHRIQKRVTSEAQAAADARQKEAEQLAKAYTFLGRNAEHTVNGLEKVEVSDNLIGKAESELPEKGIVIPVKMDTEQIKAEFLNLQNLMTEGVTIIASAFGQLVGDLATGGDAWNNFGQNALRSLGGLAIQVGKLAIATGVAALAIKKALMLSPWAAIAAGAALVALGTAVTAGMANIANGGYSSSAGVAQSTTTQELDDRRNGYGHETMDVRVTGTLKASGNALVAVINNENERINHTT